MVGGGGGGSLGKGSLQLPEEVEAEGEPFADQSGSLLSKNNVTVTQIHESREVVNEAQSKPSGPVI